MDTETMARVEKQNKKYFVSIFDVYHSAGGLELSSFTHMLFSFLENCEDAKTMVAFQAVGKKYKDCFARPLLRAKTAKQYEWNSMSPLLLASWQGQFDDVNILLEMRGIDVNQRGGVSGDTALINAASNGKTDIVKLLLNQDGIQVNKGNNNGFTPLYFAVTAHHTNIVQLLLKQEGIKLILSGKLYKGKKISSFALRSPVIWRLLEEKMQKINAPAKSIIFNSPSRKNVK